MNDSSEIYKTQLVQILVVEDEYILAINLQEILESLGYVVVDIVSSAEEAIEKAQKLRPNLVLMDICLQSQMDGIQAAEQIWNHLHIPVIYVTGHSDKSTVERATLTLPFGYILKPVKDQELYVAIQTALNRYQREQFLMSELEKIRDVVIPTNLQLCLKCPSHVYLIHQLIAYQQMQATNEELKRQINLDSLTQIANRRRFDECFKIEWCRLKRDRLPLSLILLDIDFFKLYNDTYGHLMGDDCLQQVATALKSVVQRPADLVARYGGEEFVVILPNTENQGAIFVAEKILETVRNLAIPHIKSSINTYVTVSIGFASIVPNFKLSPRHLIEAADTALYQAKLQGRDRISIGVVNGF
ncbi:MAG: diguanylate cyclase domain-containing protein [Nostoc sp. ZfuVER08]|jgi:diguanylate cyclase (GGDEF)-like protein|uniref:Diguanylate cyclase n=1 Tax=Nostoc punctiforme FACHB-252 TaxID=1357509 RepID=A0ABR8HAP9_NOSPU|nr:diguanylate cyclase [Nostoc punctiforme]MBD2612684.1 diguanylate cyclase [Nostoc punctiforme FACHB-252]MDZ8014590.1 diguanylate cyclase [Nostoc sp. ZfuVER08]